MSEWQEAETFAGDRSFESPVFTYDGAATIFLNVGDFEGAAISLRMASGIRDSVCVDLTLDEAKTFAAWLLRAVMEIEQVAA